MVYLLYHLISVLFFDIPLLDDYINRRSLIICCLFFRNLYVSLIISSLFVIVSELFFGEVFDIFVILTVSSFPIKSKVASAAFWIALFKVVLNTSVTDCLA